MRNWVCPKCKEKVTLIEFYAYHARGHCPMTKAQKLQLESMKGGEDE
tara:strand:- start:339 stop:479 length:141 start_codon:yes stop_codon:yes gene_type:complete